MTEHDILVLKNTGPLTPAGMPEAGYLPIPSKLARAGVKDMVRMSDCRMSGTAFGTIVLHITPEAAAGGPLALVESGDRIRMSVRDRKLDLLVDAATLEQRRAAWQPPATPRRGWDRHRRGAGAAGGRRLRPGGAAGGWLSAYALTPVDAARTTPRSFRLRTPAPAQVIQCRLGAGEGQPPAQQPMLWRAVAPLALRQRTLALAAQPRTGRAPRPTVVDIRPKPALGRVCGATFWPAMTVSGRPTGKRHVGWDQPLRGCALRHTASSCASSTVV